MSQMRDIQKLRQGRSTQYSYGPYVGSTRHSQPNSSTQSSQYSQSRQYNQYQADFYNIHFERESSRNHINKHNESQTKKNTSK